ncbi:MAG: DUF3379 domain-containing protein [Verrucomicrobiales bacterium]|nr:DUF3379 domain-containing protein [Verrucomicrobiales bacterium]
MNSLEAKFILEACRAHDLDAADPKIAEALQAMEADPELAQWFAASQEFDQAVVAKLKVVPVPGDLAERIRAGKSVSSAPRRWQRREWLALAALVAILAVLASFLIPRSGPTGFAAFRNDMADFMDQRWDHTFDLSDADFAKIRSWLEARAEPIKVDVPLTLAASRTYGCKTLQWHGTTATLICFVPEKAGTVVHILVVDRSALTDAPGEEPLIARVSDWNSAIWSRGDKVYLALTTAESAKLNSCL